MKVFKWLVNLIKRMKYSIYNTGSNQNLNFSVRPDQLWIKVNPSSGSLPPNGRADIDVTIGPEANTYLAGNYSGNIVFTNTSTGRGNTQRQVTLIVNNESIMAVYPIVGSIWTGSTGGPFVCVVPDGQRWGS